MELGQSAGMRLSLPFSAARYLASPAQRRRFRLRLAELPEEVLLYWFTLCFYGHRMAAGRAALRTLLTYEGPEGEAGERPDGRPLRTRPAPAQEELPLLARAYEPGGTEDPRQEGGGAGLPEETQRLSIQGGLPR